MTRPTVAAETRSDFHLPSLPNFRDIGGLPVSGEGTVRYGLVVRAEGPRHLSVADIGRLRGFGFRLVVDLRTAEERLAAPNTWCEGLAIERFDADVLTDLHAVSNEGWTRLRRDPTAAGAREAMLLNYRGKPGAMAPYLREVFGRIVSGRALPLLVHCTAGKDRTGFAIAMLLLALDASRETVFADYRRTDALIGDRFDVSVREAYRRTFGTESTDETIAALRCADPAYLQASFDAIEAGWGSTAAYLREALDVGTARAAALRSLLVA